MKILTICGSLRARSFNAALARALPELAPTASFESANIADLPLYNDDVTGDPAVARLRDQVSQAQAVVFVMPEYNFGVPGPLKNAIDWASRPGFASPFYQKPVGLMGASTGPVGTARGQGQLKQVLLGMACQVFGYREILVNGADKRFDADLKLTDEETRKLVGRYLEDFQAWVTKVG
jgi:chromate reductase